MQEKNMTSNLNLEKAFWNFLRYDYDIENENKLTSVIPSHYINNYFKNGLLIDINSSPKIDKIISDVCASLLIPRTCITFFVYASSEIQATCLNVSLQECIIQVSSGLVNLLNEKELSFVIGHELGHFIFNHGIDLDNENSVEKFQRMRSQEISVDRVGLISCGKLDYAMSAMLKTISGLDENFLDFNIGHFVNQVHKATIIENDYNFMDTHPSLIVRSRALLLFATSGILDEDIKVKKNVNLKKINQNIKNEFNKFVDFPLNKKISEIINECAIWKSAKIILLDEKFDKQEQIVFENRFNKKTLDQLKNFINSYSKNDVVYEIDKKLNENKRKLEFLTPTYFQEKYMEMDKEITKLFKH